MSSNRHIVDRALPSRSMLKFYFPTPGESKIVVDLPFFQNIKISESKRARYDTHSLLSRSSNLYTYLGAESRRFKLEFSMSLPHMEEEHPGLNFDQYINAPVVGKNTEEEKRRFFEPSIPPTSRKGTAFKHGLDYTANLARESARQVVQSDWFKNSIPPEDRQVFYSTYNLEDQEDRSGPGTVSPLKSAVGDFLPIPSSDLSQALQFSYNVDERTMKRLKTVDMIVYWVNIVRASMLNNALDTSLGPPIVRIRHGVMYQDVACICTDYSIKHDESAGHDIRTLLPRMLNVSMTLEEVRAGDFGEFDPNDQVKKDNLAGWESVLMTDWNSTDPGSANLR